MPFDNTNTNPSAAPPPTYALDREAAPLPAYRAASRLFRVFWACGGDCWFRDEHDQKHIINRVRLRQVQFALARMASTAHEAERLALFNICTEATEALRDAVRWSLVGKA